MEKMRKAVKNTWYI